MERSLAQRGRNRVRFVPEDDDHLITNGLDGIIRGANERLRTVGGWPKFQLFRSAHTPATAGGKENTNATRRQHKYVSLSRLTAGAVRPESLTYVAYLRRTLGFVIASAAGESRIGS